MDFLRLNERLIDFVLKDLEQEHGDIRFGKIDKIFQRKLDKKMSAFLTVF